MKSSESKLSMLTLLASMGVAAGHHPMYNQRYTIPFATGRVGAYQSADKLEPPHSGDRQAFRQRRQGLHTKLVNGFPLMQMLRSRDRAAA